jgi:S-(hydroxymethyl)glutathione dehydrogenase/alcohol dehydrogenase
VKALLYTEAGLEFRDDIVVREPEPDEVLVRIVNAGLCHSDVSVLDRTIPYPPPVVLGHEGAGIVETVGADVTTVAVGDHVVVTTIMPCGKCRWCNVGRPTWCRAGVGQYDAPFRFDGTSVRNFAHTSTFVEHTVVREAQVVKIPADIPLHLACVVPCAVTTGLGAVFNRASVQPGQTAAVFGIGGVGLSAVGALRLKGASRVIAVDTVAAKEPMARQFGATDFVLAGNDVVAQIRALLPFRPEEPTGPAGAGGVDWAFECTGQPAVVEAALEALDWGGTCVVVGQPPPLAEARVRLTNLLQVDRTLMGTRAGGVRPQYDVPLILGLYRRGDFDLDSLVTAVYPLDRYADAIDDLHEGRIARGVFAIDPT